MSYTSKYLHKNGIQVTVKEQGNKDNRTMHLTKENGKNKEVFSKNKKKANEEPFPLLTFLLQMLLSEYLRDSVPWPKQLKNAKTHWEMSCQKAEQDT